MFRRAGCSYCLTWDRVIGPIYPKSDLGRRAPVRMIDLDRALPVSAQLHLPVHFTPTFVLIDDGREVGRIEGYPGEDFFWGLVERLVEMLPPRKATELDVMRSYRVGPR